MRKPQVKGGPGRSWVGPGRSRAGPGEFSKIFGGPGGRKKKLHFREANRMKLSGTNYRHLKTENLLLFHGSISEKLSLYQNFRTKTKHLFFFCCAAAGEACLYRCPLCQRSHWPVKGWFFHPEALASQKAWTA